jgi:hypothetical protein
MSLKISSCIEDKNPIDPDPKPPIVELVQPPITNIFDLDAFLIGKTGIVKLPSEFDNKEIVAKSNGMIKPNGVTALIGNNTFITFESWDKAPAQLFDLSGSINDLGIIGINFVCPPNRPILTQLPDKQVFGWNRESLNFGKFAYVDVPKVNDIERITYGLCKFGYSANVIGNEMIYLIGENIRHQGQFFTQIKNPYSGNLFLHLKDIEIHNPIIEKPRSHYYSPTRIKVRVSVKDGIAKLISNNTYDQILTLYGYWENGVASLLHFDRYAYPIRSEILIDNKTLKLESMHPLDNVNGQGTIITKQIDLKDPSGFVYTYDPSTKDSPTIVTLPQGEYDAFIIYKGGFGISPFPMDKDSYFSETDYWGSGVISISQGFGWSWYNNEFSGYLENVNGSGYFRNSTGSGITKGLTIKNCIFQENPPLPTANSSSTPKDVTDYLNWLRTLK